MAEDRGRDLETTPPRSGTGEVDVHVRDSGLQSGSDTKPGSYLSELPGRSMRKKGNFRNISLRNVQITAGIAEPSKP